MAALISVESFRHIDVVNQDGETLGNGESVVVDLSQGNVVVVIISYRDKLIGIPWELIEPSGVPGKPGAGESIVVNVEPSQLEKAPTVGSDTDRPGSHWQTWSREVYEHFDLGVPWVEPQGPGAALDAPPGP